MSFCDIISKIVGIRSPKEPELTLSFTSAEPVVLHVHGFGFALDDGVISNTNCSGVIILYGRFGLIPTHLDKGPTKLDYGFGADKEVSNFGFDSRGHEKLDYLGDSERRYISGRDRSVFVEHDVGTSADSGFADIEIGSIVVVRNHHSISLVEDAIVRIISYIIKELEKVRIGIFSGRSLLLAKIVGTKNEFVINSLRVMEEGDNNGLDEEDAFVV